MSYPDDPRWITSGAKAAAWIAFLAAAAWVRHAERDGPLRRRRAVNGFLALALVLSFGPGITRRDAWPFASWPMMADVRDPSVSQLRAFGLDGLGNEHVIDYRAWEPLQWEELIAWMGASLPAMSDAERERVGRYLLDKAEAGRAQAHAGNGVGYLTRRLGPLTAPEHILHPRVWTSPSEVPPEPFVALRLVDEDWDVDSGRTTSGGIRRRVLFEYRRVP